MVHPRKVLGKLSAKAWLLVFTAAVAAVAAPATALALDGYPDLATVQQNGSTNEIMWPDGQWVETGQANTYAWKTYIKGDNAHYGHYDVTTTFTTDGNGTLTAIDLSSYGTTVGGRWGTLTPHGGSGLLGFLPAGVKSTTSLATYAEDQTIRTIGLDGAGAPGTVTGSGRNAVTVYGDDSLGGYGGYTINSISLRKIDEQGAVATYEWVDPEDGDVEIKPVGASVSAVNTSEENDTFTWDAEAKSLTVKDTSAGYNVLCVEYKIGDYYVFETRDVLTDEAGAAIYANETTDMNREPTGIGASDRDIYTAAAYNIIVRKQLPSFLAYEDGSDELADIDIVSAATKSSDSIIEAIYASQGIYYPASNHDNLGPDAAVLMPEWGQKFNKVADDVAVTIDGMPLAADSTQVVRNDDGTASLTEGLFGDNIPVAGFDLYALDGEQSIASLWRLAKGDLKDSAKASYKTGYVSAKGHGLVGSYGLSPADGSGQTYRDRTNPVEDVLDDDTMTYDPVTKTISIKDPTITHVVVQYAVGKFNDAAGGVCGISYEIPALVVAADKTALNSAIADAESTAKVATSTDGKDVASSAKWTTQAVLDAFTKAIADAKAVAANDDATQEQIDKAAADLAAAQKTYVAAQKAGTKASAPVVTVNPSIAGATVSGIANKTYTGSAITQKITVVLGGKTLKNGTDYTVTYKNNINAGTASVVVTGKGSYSGSVTKTFKIAAKKVTPAVTLAAKTYVYNGKAKKPGVTVKVGSKTLKKGTDYTVSYAKGRKAVGTYKVAVALKGNYAGSKTVSFKITPKASKVSKLAAASKAFTATWAKQAKQVTGYQIQYSTNKNFKGAKTVTVKGAKNTSKKISKLKAKTKYYVRVRTYTKVGKTNYYSTWSKAKAVTTKK